MYCATLQVGLLHSLFGCCQTDDAADMPPEPASSKSEAAVAALAAVVCDVGGVGGWLDPAAVAAKAAGRACGSCGQTGHLRYACPARLDRLRAASGRRLALAVVCMDGCLPVAVAARVGELLRQEIEDDGKESAAASRRARRQAKTKAARARRQEVARVARNEAFAGLDKAGREALFTTWEMAKAAQIARVQAAGGGALSKENGEQGGRHGGATRRGGSGGGSRQEGGGGQRQAAGRHSRGRRWEDTPFLRSRSNTA